MRRQFVIVVALALFGAKAESNIDPAHSLISSDLIGNLEWLPSAESGAVISQYFCSGYIYGGSIGWINLGSGTPANGLAYQNNAASDFGINVSAAGELRGFAYGANIGWVNFAPPGNPRVDWGTGKLSGAVWAANVGWIPLTNATQFIRIESLPDLPDTDGDGLPDAWEIQVAGTLTALNGSSDTDHDGQSDLDEYLAGTNPLDPADFLGPLRLTVNSGAKELQFPTKSNYVYRIEQHGAFGSGIWSAAPTPLITGTGATAVVQLQSNPDHLFFYRLVAYPPLSQVQ